jgi:hypothetical protein
MHYRHNDYRNSVNFAAIDTPAELHRLRCKMCLNEEH